MTTDAELRGYRVERSAWRSMHDRCKNPRNAEFKYYGGRGIAVCERWESFANFLADMGPRPTPGHSLDRKDNDGNYEPGNCRWATKVEQARNRRDNRFLTIGGESRTVAEWSEVSGLRYNTIKSRLACGWSEADVLRPVARGVPYRAHEVRP